jgi:hypothetical protein
VEEIISVSLGAGFQSGDFGILLKAIPEYDPIGWKGMGDQQDHRGPAGQWYWDEDGNLRTMAGFAEQPFHSLNGN